MERLKSNAEWKQWGKDDPLFGVASWAGRDKGGDKPWTDEDFYSLGESDWRDFVHHWQHYGVDRGSCLEFGCGAGRVTRQLSDYFEQVYAVDISKDMVERAKKAAGINVSFSIIDGIKLPHADRSVKAVFSTHVLQHLDSLDIGVSCFREFYRVLDVGGTLMIHFPVYQLPGGRAIQYPMRWIYSFSRRLGQIRADRLRRKGVKTMRGTSYPIQTLTETMKGMGFTNIEFRIFPTKANDAQHPFVFATKG